jgi:hypothetical protein
MVEDQPVTKKERIRRAARNQKDAHGRGMDGALLRALLRQMARAL